MYDKGGKGNKGNKGRVSNKGNKRVHAPYNFVPFTENRLLQRYERCEDLPCHNRIDGQRLTGEIHITMEAKTPVFISDGQKPPHFFRNVDGRPTIPGSSLRGMVRENMQILSFGLVRPKEDVSDHRIFFREIASAGSNTGEALKERYHNVMGVVSQRGKNGKTRQIPQNVKAGYLFMKNGTYWIQPTKGRYLRVSRTHEDLKEYQYKYARTMEVNYTVSGQTAGRVVPYDGPAAGMKKGTLLFTGKSVSSPNGVYLFPEEDISADPIRISKEDALAYQEDWERRRNHLRGGGYDPKFWAIAKGKERKPVFYIRYENHTYFGMSQYIRVAYTHPVCDGLPRSWKKQTERDQKERLLDYVSSMLGYAAKQESYRSRVSFGDLTAMGSVKEQKPVPIILREPNPGYYPGYLTVGGQGKSNAVRSYCDDEFVLRGYKQYWLKNVEKSAVTSGDQMYPLAEGTRFKGVIRYQNLAEDELGLLLWALRLEKDCYQSIGMGKPYGYGRMKLTIDELDQFDMQTLYTPQGLCGAANPAEDTAAAVERYIRKYDTYVMEALHIKKAGMASIRDIEEIQDFFYIRSHIMPSAEVSYMKLGQYRNREEPLPRIRDYRGEKKGQDR